MVLMAIVFLIIVEQFLIFPDFSMIIFLIKVDFELICHSIAHTLVLLETKFPQATKYIDFNLYSIDICLYLPINKCLLLYLLLLL